MNSFTLLSGTRLLPTSDLRNRNFRVVKNIIEGILNEIYIR